MAGVDVKWIVAGACLAGALALSGCNQAETATADAAPAAATDAAKAPAEAAAAAAPANAPAAAPASGPVERTITGTLVAAEDAGFPLFNLGITPPGAREPTVITWNSEGSTDVDGVSIDELVGKTVTVTYQSQPQRTALRLVHAGTDLLYFPDSSVPELPPGAVTVSGVLGGAGAPTAGDLPDTLTVTTSDGRKIEFDYFVLPEMVVANGQMVDLTYVDGTSDEVTAIKAGN